MLKKFFSFLAIGLVIFLILCWIYLPSISHYRELKLEEEKLTQKIQEIDAKIKTLADERNLLQTDVAYLEKVIREELGFVKPGEIVYEFIAKKNLPNTQSVIPANSSDAVNATVRAPEASSQQGTKLSGKTSLTSSRAKKASSRRLA